MSDEYSDETYSAWLAFSAAVRDRSRDWLRLGQPVNPLQQLAERHARMRNMTGLQAAQAALYLNQRHPTFYNSPLGGILGSLL